MVSKTSKPSASSGGKEIRSIIGSHAERQGAPHEQEFLDALRQALARLAAEWESCPFLKAPVWSWIENLGSKAGPENYFLHPSATPVFLIPWWFERSLNGKVDYAFHIPVMYATLNLCYYVRLLDDAVDGHKNTAHLLCALSFFHCRYQGAYAPLFAASDPFWRHFLELNDQSCDVTAHDTALKNVSLPDFQNIVARKSCAALVSVAAIAARYERFDAFRPWADFWYAFGRWNQMRDDLLDWQTDLKSGIDTYLLSEARRRKDPREEVVDWLIREGFDWAGDTLEVFGSEARSSAAQLGSPEVYNYVDMRVKKIAAQVGGLTRALAAISAAAR